MSGTENEVVFARLKALQDLIKTLKPGKSDTNVVAIVQEVLGFLVACSSQDVIIVAIKVLEDGIVLSSQAGTILRLEGGLKHIVKHLRNAATLPSVAGPCARILAVAAATSTVTQQALAKEKGLGALLLSTCALHVRDPAIAGPLCEVMAHISRSPKGAQQLESDGLLPVMQELLVSYLANWPVFGWVLQLLKNLAKHEYTQSGGAMCSNGNAVGSATSFVSPRNGGVLSSGSEGVRMLLGVARVLARIPEQRKLLKRVSRTLWLLCPHLLVPLPPLEPLVTLPHKDTPHLLVPSAAETDAQRHQELFPEEYPWQPQQSPPQPQQVYCLNIGWQGGSTANAPITVRPLAALPARPPSARQACRGLSGPGATGGGAPDGLGSSSGQALGHTPEPFHGYGSSLDCEMMLHDLQRIANPRSVINRMIYMNTQANAGVNGTSSSQSGPRELSRSPQQSMSRTQPLGASEGGANWNWNGGRAGSGMLPDLSRLMVTEGADKSVGGATRNVSTTRTGSFPDLDSFHLPQINTQLNSDAWIRADGSIGPASTQQRTSGRFAGASGLGANSRPPSPPLAPLTFHSGFESGNLRCAAQVGPREYDLFLAPDLNDRSEGGNLCQWFYFAVTVPASACSSVGWPSSGQASRGSSGSVTGGGPSQNGELQAYSATEANASGHVLSGLGQGPGIKMNIVNLRKKASLFSAGKRPVICLVKPWEEAAAAGPKARPGSAPSPATDPGVWFRAGTHIGYYPSPYRGRPTVLGEGAASRKGKKLSVAATASAAANGSSGGNANGGTGTAPTGSSTAQSTSKKGKACKAKLAASSAAATEGAEGESAGPGSTAIGPGLYCATFTLHFPVPGTYYVASCYPYTYSDLQDYLDGLQRRLANGSPAVRLVQQLPPASSPLLVRSLLCYTLSGLRVDMLTITDWAAPMEALRQRECIFMTARVHPGETCASWLMQGIVEFLCSSDPAAVTLRSSFVFKLVPMLNPDGVVNGNYRCSLAGVDLNRIWDRPVRSLYPTVYHSKRVLQQLAAAGRLALYIDIHGHSTKSDTFFYGCEPTAAALQMHSGSKDFRASPATTSIGPPDVQPGVQAAQAQVLQGCQSLPNGVAGAGGPVSNGMSSSLSVQGNGYGANGNMNGNGAASYVNGALQAGGLAVGTGAAVTAPAAGPNARVAARLRVRMLPYLTARLSTDYSFPKCCFKIRKAKLSAARVVVHREFGVAGSYTLEASLAGSSTSATHFSARDYLAMGHNLCRAICELAEVDDAALLEEMNARVTLPPL